eukprot:COSAG06_NODE_549_length_14405_cov_6.391933_13_plen_55_part_00
MLCCAAPRCSVRLPACLQGVINIADLEDVLVTDDADAAFKHITEHPLLLKPTKK